MFERFTDRARSIVLLARDEARLLNHNHIGTEHLLLGMLHEGEAVAAQALTNLGITLTDARELVREIIGRGSEPPSEHIPFTPRAKKVLELSLREALQTGNNYIGTEHVLLGLIREGEGVACQVLVRLGTDLRGARQAVLSLLAGYQARASAPPAPDERYTDSAPAPAPAPTPAPEPGSTSLFDRFNDRARRVIVLSQEEARMLRHNYVGTEHLLLGLIHENEGVAARALDHLGITLEAVREQIDEIIGLGQQAPSGHIPLTPRTRAVIQRAQLEATRLGRDYVGTEHILLGLIVESDGVAAQLLVKLGAGLDRVREQVMLLLPPGPGRSATGVDNMFTLYDPLARRIVVLSQESARMLGHNYIGGEHVLLGLIHDQVGGAGVAALESMGVAPADLRAEVERIIGSGPDSPSGHIPFTARAKKILELAFRESQDLGHAYVGPEHFLIAMLREGEGVPAQVLRRRGVDLDRARRAVFEVLGGLPSDVSVDAPSDAIEEWARWQAATLVPTGGASAELYHGVSGLVLLGQSGLHLPLGFVADVLRLTRSGSLPDERLAALHALPDVQRLRALAWPPAARVGFAALLGSGVPADPRLAPPTAPPAELRASLIRAIGLGHTGAAEPITADVLRASPRISDGTVTTLIVVGPGAVAADPALPLRLRHGADTLPALSGPQRALLEWTGARAVVPARSRAASTAPGPGLTGISRRGRLTNLLPSQLVLPPAILRHRFADRALLYRLHETETQPPVETVRILLDTSPPTFGSIGVALRIVVQAIVSTLWAARRVPTLVYLDQPGLETAVHKPSDLGAAWTHQSLEPVDLAPVLVGAQRSGQPSVLLTQHRLVADHGIVATAQLRVITTQLPGDDPEVPPEPPFHAHLTAEPTKAQLTAAVRTALAPEAR
ncbi:Clp protease N-terminal domain-containing protein [Paractinoplanes globisporus]|uniref:Clp protease N-terminal domain-containing protein n=1 Tax=Paractinoplanes globisporus TaxID=113565 RepID=A0ABW6WE11_9ACTN|nr:Clp protease N-terminal domain-containing protein [Actinoplanes globisporus]